MKKLPRYLYDREVDKVLQKSDYDCSKYAPDLLYANDKIDSLANCWDNFHQQIIEYITGTREFKKLWTDEINSK